MCEVKLKEGTRMEDFSITGFSEEAFLRLDQDEGGIVVWIRKDEGLNVNVWFCNSNSERVWVKVEAGDRRVALCQVYLRTNKGRAHKHYLDNCALLEKLREEVEWFHARNYGVVLIGDFNAHTGNEQVLGFSNHTHVQNNNGNLLVNFCKEMGLTCLNTMRWGDQEAEMPTFRRDYGNGFVQSILDYALVSGDVLPYIQSFQVHTDSGLELDSDHASLTLDISVTRSPSNLSTFNEHQLRQLKKWKSYQTILEIRIKADSSFQDLETNDQERWLKQEMKTVGLSLTTPYKPSIKRPTFSSLKLDRLGSEVRSARRTYFSSARSGRGRDENVRLKGIWAHLKKRYNAKIFLHQLRLKRKARAILRTKGRKSQKLFWNLVGGSKKRKLGIDVLEVDGEIISDVARKALMVEEFFIKKFKASRENPDPLSGDEPSSQDDESSRLGTPDRVLSDQDSNMIQAEISMQELELNIKELDCTKAEGPDGVTNGMINNLPQVAKVKLLEIYNNVLISGCVPSDWRVGEVVLVLKKNPPTKIENYRPITLISCISKLMTKILASRISAAAESSNILGPEQQGFRKGRCCEDNIFIINSILSKVQEKKLIAHLMFLDLKEAYDRVDRPTLYSKLKQLNFPDRFISFLKDYYCDDFITSSTAGTRTQKVYLSRGLRQGCNLSAILFIIYMSELGNRLRRAGVGIQLTQAILLSFLKFADDIVLFTTLWSDMMVLVRILERWCVDFKMSISVSKTKVVTPNSNLLWRILNTESGACEEVERLQQFKYLGLLQKHGLESTVICNAETKLSKAKVYQRNILRIRRLIPDKIDVYLAMWRNVALPSILYGLEALPFNEELEEELEKVQLSLGKSMLGVRQSTAGPLVYAELGLKPITLLITERKIRYVEHVMRPTYCGSKIVKLMMTQQLSGENSPFYVDLARRLKGVNLRPIDIDHTTLRSVQKQVITDLSLKIRSFKSLDALPIPNPKSWWKKQLYVKEEDWSRTLSEFRGGNARLGNRDDSLASLCVANDQGRVVSCPLCLRGPNNEVHLLVECSKMIPVRNQQLISGATSLQTWIDEARMAGQLSLEIAQQFLGEQKSLVLGDFVTRGNILIEMRDSFRAKVLSRLN